MKLISIARSKFTRYAFLGIATGALLSACGGGVEVVYDGTNPPQTLAHVTDALAERASKTALTGGATSVYAPAGSLLDSVSALLEPDTATGTNLYTTQTLNISSVCAVPGGQLTLQTVDAGNDRRFTAGDSASLSFSNCTLAADGLAITLNGTLTMTVQSARRGADVVVTYYFSPQNLSGTLNGVSASYSGLAGIEYAFPGGNLNAPANIAYVSDRIALSFAGSRSDVVTQMRWPVTVTNDTNNKPFITTLYPSHVLTLNEGGYTDVFTTSTVSPVQFRHGTVNLFTTAQLRHTHPIDSVLTTITATNQARTDIDFFADGTTDRILNTPVSTLINSF